MNIDKNEDLDILNPDMDVSKNILDSLMNEVYDDLKDQLSELADLPDEEKFCTKFNTSIGVKYIESLGINILEDFKTTLFSIHLIASYIRYDEQQRMLTELINKYLTEKIPELDLKDPCKIMFKKNFSNTFLLFKDATSEKLHRDCLEIKYQYQYDSGDFIFKIMSPNGASFEITISQLRMLLGLDNINTTKNDVSTQKVSGITILMPDGKKIII